MYFLGDLMSKERDINTLIKLSRKLGNSWCDLGTFEEKLITGTDLFFGDINKYEQVTHTWEYTGNLFMLEFPKTPTKSLMAKYAVIDYYYQMRRKLKDIGLSPPEFSTKLIGSVEQQKVLEEMWEHIGTEGQ